MAMKQVGRLMRRQREGSAVPVKVHEAAKALKISRYTYMRWESGKTKPRTTISLRRLAVWLGIGLEELLKHLESRDRSAR